MRNDTAQNRQQRRPNTQARPPCTPRQTPVRLPRGDGWAPALPRCSRRPQTRRTCTSIHPPRVVSSVRCAPQALSWSRGHHRAANSTAEAVVGAIHADSFFSGPGWSWRKCLQDTPFGGMNDGDSRTKKRPNWFRCVQGCYGTGGKGPKQGGPAPIKSAVVCQ